MAEEEELRKINWNKAGTNEMIKRAAFDTREAGGFKTIVNEFRHAG